jgi:hypothetical protein
MTTANPGGDERRPLLRALALGLVLFAAALALACWTVPEWQVQPLPERGLFERRYPEIPHQNRLRDATGRP